MSIDIESITKPTPEEMKFRERGLARLLAERVMEAEQTESTDKEKKEWYEKTYRKNKAREEPL